MTNKEQKKELPSGSTYGCVQHLCEVALPILHQTWLVPLPPVFSWNLRAPSYWARSRRITRSRRGIFKILNDSMVWKPTHRTLVRKCWSRALIFCLWGLGLNYTVMGFDCNALLLTDFSLGLSQVGGLPQLGSRRECNRSPNPTAPTTTNCRLHQEINNLSVTENWHLTAKGRLVRSALKNLSCCFPCSTCSGDNEGASGFGTVSLTPLTSSKS